MNVSFYYSSSPDKIRISTGCELEKRDLKELMAICVKMGRYDERGVKREKGACGSILAFIDNHYRGIDDIKERMINTNGALFCDFDNMRESDVDKIIAAGDDIKKDLPNILCLYKSYSGNLHAVFYTDPLYWYDYQKQELTAQLYLAQSVYKNCGVLIDNSMIDLSNMKITQQIWLNGLSREEIYWNDDALPMCFREYEKVELKMMKREWKKICNKLLVMDGEYENMKFENDYTDAVFNFTSHDIGEKIYTERSQRFTVFSSIRKLCGGDSEKTRAEYLRCVDKMMMKDHGREWYVRECDKWLKEDSGKDNYSFALLKKFGYKISVKRDEENIIKKGEFISCSKFKNKILKFIKDNTRVEIVAPTGVGKTSFINGRGAFSDDDDVFADDFSLAKYFGGGSVTVVPYNVTNKLYDNLTEISSEKSDNTIRPDGNYVMVWDQVIKYWEEIKGMTIIVDEAHCLYLERRFRDVAVRFMNYLKNYDGRVILFTATPVGEAERLGCKKLVFKNERELVDVKFIKVDHVDLAQFNYIKYLMAKGFSGKIVLFDDRSAKKVYENLLADGRWVDDISYIRADTKESDDFKDLRVMEMLTKKITICTCVAFNGLNFKNSGEDVIVISSFRKGETTAAVLIQESGRIRKSDVGMTVFFDDRVYGADDEDLTRRVQKSEIMNDAVVKDAVPESVLSYDRRLTNKDIVEALFEINETIHAESDLGIVWRRLRECGYYNNCGYVVDMTTGDDMGDRLKLVMKKKESEEFIEDMKKMMNEEESVVKDLGVNYEESRYKYTWKKRMDKIIDNYIGISIETFLKFVQKKNKNMMVDTVLDKLEKIIAISTMIDDRWNNYMKSVDKISKRLGDMSEIEKKRFLNDLRLNKKIRNRYKGMVIVKDNGSFDVSNVIGDLFSELEKEYEEEKKKRSVAMKKNGRSGGLKTKRVKDSISGEVFESVNDAAKFFGKTPKTIIAWEKKGRIVKVDDDETD